MQTNDAKQKIFQLAVEQYSDSTYRVAYRLTANHELARELVQETYLAAWRNLNQLQNPDSMRGWIMGILRNQFSKQWVRERRNSHQFLEVEPMVAGADQQVVTSVQDAIAQLDEDHRLPILLVSMEGWSTEEVANLLEIPRGTVLSRLHRARLRLKKILLADWQPKANET
jgi:RNA polymerase sigma-70 factor (ECF subfamily)